MSSVEGKMGGQSVSEPRSKGLATTRRPARWRPSTSWIDPLLAVALGIAAYLVRRRGLPTDGLWYDDAWVAAGAAKAGLGDLLVVSTNHPGYTAALMAWTRVVSPRSELMAWPGLAAATLTVPLLFLVLRRWGVAREAALAVGTLLVVSAAHVQYATRVKSYVFETLIVVVLTVVLPRLSRTRWRAATAISWVAACLLLGTISVFALTATAVATLVLVLHANADRRLRLVALGVQGVLQGLYLRTVQQTFDSELLTKDWETVYDGFIELDAGPSSIVRQLASHSSRYGQSVLGGRGAVPLLLVLVSMVGLAVASREGPRRVTARFLLALPVLAVAGSVVGVIPFGASNAIFFSPGWRASLWLVPSLLIGFAFALDLSCRAIARRKAGLVPFARAALVVLALFVVVTGWDRPSGQPLSGSRTAEEYLAAHLEPDGFAIMFGSRIFPYAAEPGTDIAILPAPETPNGWTPVVLDDRIWVLAADPWVGSTAGLERRIQGRSSVIIHNGFPGYGDGQLPVLEAALSELGFVEQEKLLLGNSVEVARWERR